MVQVQDDTTRRQGRPMVGVLGALGLTFAFVALRRSTRGQGDEASDSRKAQCPGRRSTRTLPSAQGTRRTSAAVDE